MLLRVFLTNLGKYNEGELVGKWVDIDENSTMDDFEEDFKEIGINEEYEEYDEYFITDYESPFEIGEYEYLQSIIDKCKKCDEIVKRNSISEEVLKSLLQEYDIEDLVNADIYLHSGLFSMAEVAEEYIYKCYDLNKMGHLAYFIDYEAFGRDMALKGDFEETKEGVVEIVR